MTKISVIGAGEVGATTAYALLTAGVGNEIVLIDVDRKKVAGEALDLQNGLPFVHARSVVGSTDYKAIKGSQIVVITAGAKQKPGESRLDLLGRNVTIIRSIVSAAKKHASDAVFIFVTNPVDVLTYIGMKLLKGKKGKVFGSGTTLDSARLRDYTSQMLNVNPANVHAYILGEHGDCSFPVWSRATMAGAPIKLNRKMQHSIAEKVRKTAYEIIEKKGETSYAIGLAVADICDCIVRDKKKVFPLSVVPSDYGITDVCLSVPCVLGKNGVERTIKVPLNDAERRRMKKAAKVIKENISKVNASM